jgi:lactate permease
LENGVFPQILTPVGGSLGLSFLVAILPVGAVLVLLGVLRRPAWEAALAGLAVGLVVAVGVWAMPVRLALDAVLNGAVFALWPVMWIVVNALLLYNIAVRSGRFEAFRNWIVMHLPNDRRVVLVVIGFCFGALLEGIAGFGTPVAITSSLLILVGYRPLEALVFVLIFNTAPVAFGALGAPVTVLGAVTGLPPGTLAAMIGRQLPVMALILPFYVMALYGGVRSLRALWPVLLVAGGSFGVCQFLASNYVNYTLTDVLSSLGSLAVTLAFLQVWRPVADPDFTIESAGRAPEHGSVAVAPWQGWLPWILVSAVVIMWTAAGVAAIGQRKINWPGLHKTISITLYAHKPYEAVWVFQPLGTGTAILLAAILLRPGRGLCCCRRSWGGLRYCFPAATHQAMRCSATCKWLRLGNFISVRCCLPRPTRRVA